MARQKLTAKERRKARRHTLVAEVVHDHEWWNGGGCEPYDVKCGNCQSVIPGGEQYGFHKCPRCNHEVAFNIPQLL